MDRKGFPVTEKQRYICEKSLSVAITSRLSNGLLIVNHHHQALLPAFSSWRMETGNAG